MSLIFTSKREANAHKIFWESQGDIVTIKPFNKRNKREFLIEHIHRAPRLWCRKPLNKKEN